MTDKSLIYNLIRSLYLITLKPAKKGFRILKSWTIIFWRIFLYGIIKGQKTDKYEIKTGYVARTDNKHFDDTNNKDEFQDGVYKRILEFFNSKQLNSIIDIGCGSGYKLIKYFGGFQTLGMDIPPALDHLKQKYQDRSWAYSDFTFTPDKQYDIVISVDVIEHLNEPENLLNYIIKLKPKYVVLSTPDRNKLPYRSRLGPPMNAAHIREWNEMEFTNYFSRYFDIIESNIIDYQDHCIIGTPKKTGYAQ